MDDLLAALGAITAIIAVVVTLINANHTFRQSAFKELQAVVERLDKDLKEEKKERGKLEDQLKAEKKLREKLEQDLAAANSRADRVERWAHALVNQLKENHIRAVRFEEVP